MFQTVHPRVDLLGSVVFTGWSVYKTIELDNIAAISEEGGSALVNLTTSQDFRDTWRAALGANYHISDVWMMRIGGGYDQTPTVKVARDIRLPDSDRWALSVGTHYQWFSNIGIDAGYTYLFGVWRASVNNTIHLSEISSTTIQAQAKNHAQLVGLQVVWTV